jgi:hypothetical protein
MRRMDDRTTAQVERAQFRRRVAGVESREPPRVSLPDEHRLRLECAQLERSGDLRDGQHLRGAAVAGIGGGRERAEHVDDDGDTARRARAGHVVVDFNSHGSAPRFR